MKIDDVDFLQVLVKVTRGTNSGAAIKTNLKTRLFFTDHLCRFGIPGAGVMTHTPEKVEVTEQVSDGESTDSWFSFLAGTDCHNFGQLN